ncbi:MAG: glucosaminidase domain-containing protein [Crocinitomicaceae bacterium]
MKRKFLFLSVLFLSNAYGANLDKTALKMDYIDKWRTTAIQQMIQTKIPASITLAQGIIESAAGTSELATKGNNHFGIKCHEWDGDRMFHDDDLKGECFRVYGTAELSFVDHSEFLINRPRYAELFALNTTDYKGWARGLKKAGYATNPQYATMLINLIEEFHLDDYDASVLPQKKKHSFLTSGNNKDGRLHPVESKDNSSKFIVAQKGDTYYRISQEFSMAMWELRQYNDFEAKKDVLEEGDIVYIQPKKRKAGNEKEYIVKKKMESLASVSQDLGIKLKVLEKKNPEFTSSELLSSGTKVRLK